MHSPPSPAVWLASCYRQGMTTHASTRIAVSSWQGRVSPVFDVTRQALVAEIHDNQAALRTLLPLPDDPLAKADTLVAAGVDVLVCGAVTRPLQGRLAQCGIQVHAFIAGDVEDVLAAWLANRLGEPVFAMPGCCREKRPRGSDTDGDRLCQCPQCGREISRQAGQTCRDLFCPACSTPLFRS